AAAASSST
nr:Chain 0, P1/MAHONEY POLIOVIRUS [Human poliovirus 1 Mahoney]